jgi:hypothetical protein
MINARSLYGDGIVQLTGDAATGDRASQWRWVASLEGSSMRRRVLGSASAALFALGILTGPVLGAQPTNTYYFYDCTGGTLTSFYAVKTVLPAAEGGTASSAGAFRIVGSNQVYTVYDFGFGAPSGITVSGVASVWCWVTYSGFGTFQTGGQLSAGG